MHYLSKVIALLILVWLPSWLFGQEAAVLPIVDEALLTTPTVVPEVPAADPAEIETRQLSRFDNRSPPNVVSRHKNLVFYPCSQCHRYWKTNPVPHELAPVHRVGLNHGNERFWCLTCHDADDRDSLRTERDGKVGFNESWRICGQCHANRQRDWYFGAHGKRANGWQEDPMRYNCTHCHDPHFPPFAKHQPQPKPLVRSGLQPMKRIERMNRPVWERHGAEDQETGDD